MTVENILMERQNTHGTYQEVASIEAQGKRIAA
jgi:hypothetical protein